MGKVILCAGRMAEKPWTLTDGGKVWSVEELCYYVYQNIYGIEENFFDPGLMNWLEQECGLPETAEKLRWLQRDGYGQRDKIVALLCSADYYTESEIVELIQRINEMESMPEWQRKKHRADEMLRKGHYARAWEIYEKILTECELTEEEKGVLYHNIGIIRMHTTSLIDAAETFYQAYQLGRHPESCKLCLLTAQMSGHREYVRQMKEEMAVGEAVLRTMESEWNRAVLEADQSEEMGEIEELFRQRSEGRITDAYEGLDRILDQWKRVYRDGVIR